MIDAKKSGKTIDEVDPSMLALTVEATMEDALNSPKVGQNLDKLHYCGRGLIQYLQQIRKQG